MELKTHPEYERYQADGALLAAIGPALAEWLAAGEPLVTATAVFTPAAVRQLLADLVTLLQAYNRVLWQEFDYCRQCRGGCCVVGASQVTAVDVLALTVLDEPLPHLPGQTHHDDHACIYLGVGGCTWPGRWRPLKCQIFYCLGSGDWQLDAADERYGRLTRRLQAVVAAHWPDLLPAAEAQPLVDGLADPLRFAAALTAVLTQELIAPLVAHLGLVAELARDNSGPVAADALSETQVFIAAMMAQLETLPDAETAVAQLYADLETLQWVAAGQPGNSQELLAEVGRHYAADRRPGNAALRVIHRQMAAQVSLLCEKMEN